MNCLPSPHYRKLKTLYMNDNRLSSLSLLLSALAPVGAGLSRLVLSGNPISSSCDADSGGHFPCLESLFLSRTGLASWYVSVVCSQMFALNCCLPSTVRPRPQLT